MAADSVSDSAVLFGGQSGATLDSLTQVYNETTDSWSVLHPSVSPTPRSYFAFAPDASLRGAVLFGGVVNASSRQVDNTTWVYQFANETWVNVSKAIAPEPREDSAFAINPAAGYGLLYGGWNQDYTPTSSITYSDLWRFNLSSNNWSRVAVVGPELPPPLHGAAFAWDPVANEFDLFGGCYPCSNAVWQFNPVTNEWSPFPAANGTPPAPRADSSWNWDPVNSADVLFGGTNSAVSFDDTFEFFPANDRWTEEEPTIAPSARFATASAWLNETGNETLLLSGGNSSLPAPDLWRLSPTSNVSIQVLNLTDGAPVGGANVSVDDLPALRTNDRGYLNLTQLNATETLLNVTELGYEYATNSFWLTPASSRSVEISLSPVAPATLFVTVVSPGGEPLANASVKATVDGVSAPGSPLTTGATGTVGFSSVPSEIPVPLAVVTVSAPKNYSNTTSVPIPPGEVRSVVVTLLPYPNLLVHVTGMLANGTVYPVRNATVTESGWPLGTTGVTGWLNATSLFSGTVGLVVQAEGFESATRSVSLPQLGNITVNVQLKGIPFGKLLVRVLEAESGTPIAGANVTAVWMPGLASVPASGLSYSNGTGWATLSLPEATYTLNASAFGYYPASAGALTVVTNETERVAVYLTLKPGADVDVLVHAANSGAPLDDAVVQMGTMLTGVSDPRGWANFTNVHFGFTTVNVSCFGYYNNSTQTYLLPGQLVPRMEVNLTPWVSGPGLGGGGSAPFGNFPPGIDSLWPYLVAFAVTLVGVTAYLYVLRSAREERTQPTAGQDSPTGPVEKSP